MEKSLIPSEYALIKQEYIPDCKGTGYLLKHKKSGARISVISNDDNNKVFCIAFRTPPKDNTGVAHILEHSVLCGSRKFKPKDPFMELEKGSLNTYLNALTFPDKTCYPVASCNMQDFANLMDVYLDAVFYPAIYEKEEIFRQEGWHYEVDENGELGLNGIVYSEMKGAFSSPTEKLGRNSMKAIFPDTAYRFESGGDPDCIPGLSYEEFLEFHKKYYHPSNSYISLYGDMDVTERLEFLDREYLCAFDEARQVPCMEMQPAIGEQYGEDFYPLADDDPEEDASFINWTFMLADNKDVMTNTALALVCQALFEITGAPVKEALIKKGLGKEISFYAVDEVRQPFGVLQIRNIEADKLEEVRTVVRETIESEVKKGINKRSLQSVLTRAEFCFFEEDYGSTPKGLIYIFKSLDTWLYDDDEPYAGLNVRSCFDGLRQAIDTDFYEKLVNEYLLNSPTSGWCVLKPKKGLDREENAALAEKLRKYKESLSEDELKELRRRAEKLKEYQQEPSTPEELLTVPMLRREDIERTGFVPINEEASLCGVPTLLHEIDTNGIFYFDAFFEVNGIEKEEASYLGFLVRLFGNLDTEKHTYLELDNESGIHTGGITSCISSYVIPGSEEYRPIFSISGKAFAREAEALMDLFAEVFFLTDFSSVSRIREVIRESVTGLRGMYTSSGHKVALSLARASVSNADAFSNSLWGRGLYELLCRLDSSDDEEIISAVERGRAALKKIIRREALWFNVTSTREIFDGLDEAVKRLLDGIDGFEDKCGTTAKAGSIGEIREGRGPLYDLKPTGKAYKSASDVNYVALAGIHECRDPKETAHLIVLSSIVTNEFLWNNIRILGGAYGCGFSFIRPSRMISFYSYRDPSIGKTLETFKAAAEYIRNFSVDEREMTKFVIGTIGTLDTPMTPDTKGKISLNAYIIGFDAGWFNDRRSAILDTNCEDIRKLADVVEKVTDMGNICVVGNESDIEEEKDLFENIYNLF